MNWINLKTYFKTILIYGEEVWTKINRQDSKFQAMEMKFLSDIIKQRNKKKDKKY